MAPKASFTCKHPQLHLNRWDGRKTKLYKERRYEKQVSNVNAHELNVMQRRCEWDKSWLIFSPQVSPPHLTDTWKKPCRFSQQERVRRQPVCRTVLPLFGFMSTMCLRSLQDCMKRWPCWPLSCGPMPTTKRTWSSSKTSSVRGVWDTSWRWEILLKKIVIFALN